MLNESRTAHVIAVVLAGSVLHAGQLSGQVPFMERTPQLERLEFLIGTWDTRTVSVVGGDTIVGTGDARVEWDMKGVWLLERVGNSMDMDGRGGTRTVEGRGFTAWDAAGGRYVRIWLDGQSPRVHRGTMEWRDERTLDQTNEPFEWPDGRTYQFKSQLRRIDDDTIEIEHRISMDGGRTWLWSSHQTRTRTKAPTGLRQSATELRGATGGLRSGAFWRETS